MQEALAREAGRRQYRFASMGIAVDPLVEHGYDFLQDLGHFDEITSGRGWLNAGATTYLHRDIPGSPEVPQLLVIVRDIATEGEDRLQISEDRLLVRKIGLAEIAAWQEFGFPLPTL